jgi:hypothetical protein
MGETIFKRILIKMEKSNKLDKHFYYTSNILIKTEEKS